MPIVSPDVVPVDEYAAAGRDVMVVRPACPACAGRVVWWSGYTRFIRSDGVARAIFVRRVRCRPCGTTKAVLPSFAAIGRLDVVETIGGVVDAVRGGRSGVRPAAEQAKVPHTTARDWDRRFRVRARVLAAAFAALVVELGGDALGVSGDDAVDALAGIGAGYAAACRLPGWAVLGCWRFASVVCGATLLAANTNPPWFVIGNRRFMPPMPQEGA